VICENCKKQVQYAPEILKESGLDPAEWSKVPFYEGAGCLECSGSGYRGRSAITELLDLSDHIREMIINRRPTSEIKRAAKEEGMSSCAIPAWPKSAAASPRSAKLIR
jgi:type IV pilus assembly protein PilB